MNADVKAKWLQALRSGEYQQVQGRLRDKSGFCCLGVLCDLAMRAGVDIRPDPAEGYLWDDGMGQERSAEGELPIPVRDWAGIETGTGVLPVPIEDARHLVGLNDDLGYDFGEIADVIEAQL